MEHKKPKRVKDKKLLKSYHDQYCILCMRYGCDPCHVVPVGRGGPDEAFNLFPACRMCHIQQHAIGINQFVKDNSKLQEYLKGLGWDLSDLTHPKLRKT